MSCNGCRVLRKGCSERCILRPCLQWIDSPESQGHATVFLAKFFGRAGLMSFISNVTETQRPALFQSLLFEACGRTVNPVNGAVGLLGTGNWQLCQAAVQTVLRGGTLLTIPADILIPGVHLDSPDIIDDSSDEATCSNISILPRPAGRNLATLPGLDLSLSSSFEKKKGRSSENKRRRAGSASDESGTSYDDEVGQNCNFDQLGSRSSDQVKVLELFR